jgi:hypothetical protein
MLVARQACAPLPHLHRDWARRCHSCAWWLCHIGAGPRG